MKSKLVTKAVNYKNWKIEYTQFYLNGMKEDLYVVTDKYKSIRIRCFVPFKVKNYGINTNILDSTNEPTKIEMKEYLKEFLTCEVNGVK